MASYQTAEAPVAVAEPSVTLPRQRGTAALGLAAMAAVGATGMIGLATPAGAAPASRPVGSVAADDQAATVAHGTESDTADPGTALADRILAQAGHQQADDAAARLQAAHSATQAAQERRRAQAESEAQARAAAAQTAPQSAAQAPAQLGPLVAPVANVRPAAGNSAAAYWSHLSAGQDFSVPAGTPVQAIGQGVVTAAGWAGTHGYRVIETLPDGTQLWYAHLSAIGVSAGQQVAPGQTLGRVGATGTAGPHLHLEVRPGGGEPVDPTAWLASHGVTL